VRSKTAHTHLHPLPLLLLRRQLQLHALVVLVLAQQLRTQPADLLLDVGVAAGGERWHESGEQQPRVGCKTKPNCPTSTFQRHAPPWSIPHPPGSLQHAPQLLYLMSLALEHCRIAQHLVHGGVVDNALGTTRKAQRAEGKGKGVGGRGDKEVNGFESSKA
jgi:hypothetical protein